MDLQVVEQAYKSKEYAQVLASFEEAKAVCLGPAAGSLQELVQRLPRLTYLAAKSCVQLNKKVEGLFLR